ncbi:MAG: hypothetical protein M3Z19_15560, partial [Chloroflexota bacterium]|nr:hypothetical protein [Chloroflexota bacterium]
MGSETKGGATTYYTRTPGGHLISQRTPTAMYYYLSDGLGSVVGLVDGGGNLQARYGYDPYGQEVMTSGGGDRYRAAPGGRMRGRFVAAVIVLFVTLIPRYVLPRAGSKTTAAGQWGV